LQSNWRRRVEAYGENLKLKELADDRLESIGMMIGVAVERWKREYAKREADKQLSANPHFLCPITYTEHREKCWSRMKAAGASSSYGLKGGEGVTTFADGSSYGCEYLQGVPHGHGQFRLRDGTELAGEWIEGEQCGTSTVALQMDKI